LKKKHKKTQSSTQIALKNSVLILDFGSQYTQLIARRIRESKVYSRIVPHTISAEEIKKIGPKGLVFSGGPASVYDSKSPKCDKAIFKIGIPILGICYGQQLMAQVLGGKVKHTREREYGRQELFIEDHSDFFSGLSGNITSWMSHGDYVSKLPKGFVSLAHTLSSSILKLFIPPMEARLFLIFYTGFAGVVPAGKWAHSSRRPCPRSASWLEKTTWSVA
jgi:GMP synthase (glutamine-hydrolysing)